MGYVQMFTTASKKSDAQKIADALVSKGLAACVQVLGPIQSTYAWRGKKEKAREWLCIIKTKSGNSRKALSAIKKIHTYSLPEITEVKMTGDKAYLDWIDSATKD